MATEINPFIEIRERHRERGLEWLARIAFGASTLRLFSQGAGSELRDFLAREIGDGKWLGAVNTRQEFEDRLYGIIRRFPPEVRRNKKNETVPLSFGQKAKVVNLYFKALVTQREPLDSETVRRVLPWLHVPLDGIVLKRIRRDFDTKLTERGLKKTQIGLTSLNESQYRIIQDVLAKAASETEVPTIWYDDYWAQRND